MPWTSSGYLTTHNRHSSRCRSLPEPQRPGILQYRLHAPASCPSGRMGAGPAGAPPPWPESPSLHGRQGRTPRPGTSSRVNAATGRCGIVRMGGVARVRTDPRASPSSAVASSISSTRPARGCPSAASAPAGPVLFPAPSTAKCNVPAARAKTSRSVPPLAAPLPDTVRRARPVPRSALPVSTRPGARHASRSWSCFAHH